VPFDEEELNIPDNYNVMLSFEETGLGAEKEFRMTCTLENQARIKLPDTAPDDYEGYCDTTKNTNPLYIFGTPMVLIGFRFTFNQLYINTGFKLRFSFHKQHESLGFSYETGKFICNGSYWPQFQQHFPCNLESRSPEERSRPHLL